MNNNEKHQAEATEALERLNRALADSAPEPDQRPLTLHQMLRTTPDNAVAKWKAEAEAADARREKANARMLAEQQAEVERWRAWVASVSSNASREVRDYMRDMLPIVSEVIDERIADSEQRTKKRIDKVSEASLPVLDLPNPLRARMQ